MGTPGAHTDRTLADAEEKVAQAEEAAREYAEQLAAAEQEKKTLEEENEHLRSSILSLALQNASVDLRREHVQLRQTLDSYQTKIDQMREISLLSAKVVDRCGLLAIFSASLYGGQYGRGLTLVICVVLLLLLCVRAVASRPSRAASTSSTSCRSRRTSAGRWCSGTATAPSCTWQQGREDGERMWREAVLTWR